MKKTLWVLVAILLSGCMDKASSPPKAEDGRRYSEAEWRAEVLDSTRPVLVDFWAPWCGPCRQMTPTIDALAKEYQVAKVNVDENPRLAERYDVSSIPLFLILKRGKVVARYVGVTEEETLRQALEENAQE